ncbi:hypothetical protein HDV00_011923, partial [Rhizophlyctis rosea]
ILAPHPFSLNAQKTAGYDSPLSDMTIQQNFTGFWNTWCASKEGRKTELVERDHALLDESFPERIKSAEKFFKRVDERERAKRGNLWDLMRDMKHVLKDHEARRRGCTNF